MQAVVGLCCDLTGPGVVARQDALIAGSTHTSTLVMTIPGFHVTNNLQVPNCVRVGGKLLIYSILEKLIGRLSILLWASFNGVDRV